MDAIAAEDDEADDGRIEFIAGLSEPVDDRVREEIEPTWDRIGALQLVRARHQVRDNKRVASCLGFGPRFLHSTGQAYKGGPNSGVFLQVTCDDAFDVPVPGQKYTFGIVKAAQARGDFQVLAERGRRALRVHLGTDVHAGLTKLHSLVKKALTA